ncbi:hypothetical protein DRQ53_07530 [bacterium]|nr:MAG: hypothetical protein DRQ53_07530 [bacterium]
MRLIWTIILLLAAPAWAENCVECHDEDLALDTPYAWSFEPARYGADVHASLDCTDCHTGDFDDLPHEIEPTILCSSCHDFEHIEEQVEASVHPFRCAHCHDPHAPGDLVVDHAIRDRVAREIGICLSCHGDDVRWETVAGLDQRRADLMEVHAWLPRAAKHKRVVLCVCCHTPVDRAGIHEILPAKAAQRRCESCHRQDSPVAAKFLGQPDRETWITHDVLLGDAYVKGAMRHQLVDRILIGIVLLALLGIAIHAVLRVLAARRRTFASFTAHEELLFDRWVRSWHWINALLFLVLAVTGFRIHWGGREEPLLSFETAYHVHNLVGLLLAVWFVWFLAMGAATGNDRSYWKLPPRWIRGVYAQARYYLVGVFRGDAHPFHPTRERRFNPLQQTVYLKAMHLLFPILAVSGVLLLYPEVLPETIAGYAAGWAVATVHYLCAAILSIFLVIHLYLITFGDRPRYGLQSMIDGKHRSHHPPGS